MRKGLAIILAVAALLVACSPRISQIGTRKAESDIVILYDNDVHCHIDGYAKMAAMKKDMEARFDHVAVVSSGDFSQGGPIGAYTRGESVIKVMNEVGYDIVTLGNHEFDYGFPQLYKNLGNLESEVVDCNLMDLRSGKSLFKAFAIKDFGGTKIAFVGISTPNSINSSTPIFFQDDEGNFIYGFCTENIFSKIQQTVDQARAQGADYVVALSHIGIEEDIAGLTSRIIASSTSGIDVILDGHSHSVIPCEKIRNKEGKQVILTQTGCYMDNIGRLVITPSGEITTELIPTKEYNKMEPRTAAVVDSLTEDYNRFSNRLIATTSFPLAAVESATDRPPRYQEMPIGDLCTDAFREVCDADIALQNGGTIRAGLLNDEIIFSDIFSMVPFGNQILVAEVPGSVLLDVLESSVYLTPEAFGGFLQVSGIKFEADLSVPSKVKVSEDNMFVGIGEGERRVRNVKVLDRKTGEYKSIEPDRLYKVAGSDYILSNCGNGYTMLQKYGRMGKIVMKDVEAIEKYMTEHLHGVIPERYRVPQERIVLYKKN